MQPAPPEIALPPGFTVRPVTLDDLEAAVDLFNTCSLIQMGMPDFTVESLRNEWSEPGFDLERSTRAVLTPEGRLVGYVEVNDAGATPVHPWVWGRVHPDYENRNIGTYLMQWGEERAREAIAKVPEHARVTMASGSFSTHEPTRRLLEDRGMTLIRHFYTMLIDLDEAAPEPDWPEGITLRTFNREQDAEALFRAQRDSFQDHFGYVEEPFETAFPRWEHYRLNDPEHDPTLYFLAMDGEEIAGMLLCRAHSHEDPEMGWIDILGVRRAWRKRGLGMALLRHGFGEFYRRGRKSAGLGVDASSLTGATRLYESAGMSVLRQFDLYEKELRPGEELAMH